MGKFTVIPKNTFDGLQLDAGVLLKNFDPTNPAPPADEDIICATTGGIKIDCIPTYTDLGSDVDNCPVNMKELKKLDSWECKVSFTSLGTSAESIKLSLGAADIDASGAIVPRRDLRISDFQDLWWVGDRADEGLVAVQILNALSSSGFSLQTTKSGKGTVSMELTGHVSIDEQDVMPMKFYSQDPSEVTFYSVSQMLSHVDSTFTDHSINAGDNFATTLTAKSGYTISNVVVMVGGEDVTSDAYDSATGEVAVSSVDGNIVIIATAGENA